uniref:Venom s1 protease 29 n=1 Tax=Pristhesancus plagipennis TaxID=1955184 RepID=A0A1Q1NPG4_PRIPG|nr:venom s1 protease 29 [Pristhesancus plagipennis]
MKIWVLMLICSVVISHAAEYQLNIKAEEQKRLNHKSEAGTAETHWKLKTCEGCRLIMSCYMPSKSCDDFLLIINDGLTVEKHCGPRWSSTVWANSNYNIMEVSIKTVGPIQGSFCHVAATKPYTNMEYKEIDSSEFGLGTGAKRQTSCKCGWANKSPARIVGGKETLPNEYPFPVILKIKHDKLPLCGGSIISANHILTAAHCTYPFRGIKFAVIIGEHDTSKSDETPFTKEIDVKQTFEHPKYNDEHTEYDIAIALLEEKIKFNDAVGPVCLPNSRTNLLGEYIKVMGWGRTKTKGSSSSVLLKVHLRAIDLDICREIYSSVDLKDPYQICTWAPNKDSCQGDSGGPLVWRDPETNRYVQVALVSFGRKCGSTDPAVNTDVSYFMDWIKKIISDTVPQDVCV